MLSRRRCCCGACCQTFTVLCGTTPASGATVTIKSGGTTIASGTTDSSGVVKLCVAGGFYLVTASGSTCTTTSSSLTLTCGEAHTINCCPPCSVTICADNCGGQIYTCGGTVTIKNASGTTIGTGMLSVTTGCVTITVTAGQIPSTVEIVPDDTTYGTYTGPCGACGTETDVTLPAGPGYSECCGLDYAADPFSLTDANGTYALINLTGGLFYCCTTVSSVSPVSIPNPMTGFCDLNQTASINVIYNVECGTTTTTITRAWCISAFGTQYSTFTCPTFTCAECSQPDSSVATADFTNPVCGPFAVSGTLAYTGTLPDPVGGTVSVS